jgi:O-antigen ligase
MDHSRPISDNAARSARVALNVNNALSRTVGVHPVLAWVFTIALGLSPVLLMSTMDGGSAGYYGLVLLSFIVLAWVRRPAVGTVWCDNRREYLWMVAGMC